MNARDALWAASLAVGLCTASAANTASAQGAPTISGARPEAHVGVGFHGGLGLGASVDIPIVADGFVPGVEDELALRPGGELLFDEYDGPRDRHRIVIGALIAAQWNVYLANEWSLFPEAGLTLLFGDLGLNKNVGLDLLLALGGRYHINSRNAFVLRFCYPFGLQLGFTF